PRDQALIEGLSELEAAFWKRVITETPPPDAPITRLPVHTEARVADKRVTAIVAHVRELRARYQAAKHAKDEAEEALRMVLGAETFVKGDGFSVIYRQAKDTTKVAWEQIAAAYRQMLNGRPEAEAIQSLYTRSEPGKRP